MQGIKPSPVPSFRDGLIQIELRAGKNASFEERAGNFALAEVHRQYAHAAKQARMGLPMQDLFTQEPGGA